MPKCSDFSLRKEKDVKAEMGSEFKMEPPADLKSAFSKGAWHHFSVSRFSNYSYSFSMVTESVFLVVVPPALTGAAGHV